MSDSVAGQERNFDVSPGLSKSLNFSYLKRQSFFGEGLYDQVGSKSSRRRRMW
jgi:hypothetical protein